VNKSNQFVNKKNQGSASVKKRQPVSKWGGSAQTTSYQGIVSVGVKSKKNGHDFESSTKSERKYETLYQRYIVRNGA